MLCLSLFIVFIKIIMWKREQKTLQVFSNLQYQQWKIFWELHYELKVYHLMFP
ncbi:hypothetical protein C0J52_23476 [Blattella germanica]|nr:hypothetical protein C0J52_23476 [Blattella germanica]